MTLFAHDDYPDGAVRTTDELMEFVGKDNGILYVVMNGHCWGNPQGSKIETHCFSRGAHVAMGYEAPLFHKDGRKGNVTTALFATGDCNLNKRNHYNDHFLFTDKDKAEAYLDQAKKSWTSGRGRYYRAGGI